MPLLKIGGWVSTKIRKSKTPKTSYHLHHATISRFSQPNPAISPTPFLTNHPSQTTLYFHPTNHQYSPHPNLQILLKSSQLSTPKTSSHPLRVSTKSTIIHSNRIFFMCSFLTNSHFFLMFTE